MKNKNKATDSSIKTPKKKIDIKVITVKVNPSNIALNPMWKKFRYPEISTLKKKKVKLKLAVKMNVSRPIISIK